jgi:hypothetical protein
MLKESKSGPQREVRGAYFRAFNAEGVLFARARAALPEPCEFAKHLDSAELDGMLAQLEDEGLTEPNGEASLLPWEALFEALSGPHYPQLRDLAALPPDSKAVPELESHNGLTDRNFAIVLSGWIGADGRNLRETRHFGALLESAGSLELISEAAWRLLVALDAFQRRAEAERGGIVQRRRWGEIRRLALAAHTKLDAFLRSNTVLTPEKLKISLDAQQAGGTRVVQVIPSFANAPEGWLNEFDGRKDVPELYNIKTQSGIVQVLITPDARTVLGAIKRFPGRRVAGARAEAFITNPFAALGEAASRTIDEAQFEEAKQAAGLQFERFTALIEKDAVGYPIKVALNISSSSAATGVHGELRTFKDDAELKHFIEQLRASIDANHPLCGWQGYEFQILGETPDELERLTQAYAARQQTRVLVSYANIYDLSVYTSRIDTIGTDAPYYSLFIAKKKDEDSWFPENIVPCIGWTPKGQSEPVAVPLTS